MAVFVGLPSSLLYLVKCLSLFTFCAFLLAFLCTLSMADDFWTTQHTLIFTLWLSFTSLSEWAPIEVYLFCKWKEKSEGGLNSWKHKETSSSSVLGQSTLHKDTQSQKGLRGSKETAGNRLNCYLPSEPRLSPVLQELEWSDSSGRLWGLLAYNF